MFVSANVPERVTAGAAGRRGRRVATLLALTLACWASVPHRAAADDNLVLGKRLLVKDQTGSEDARLVLILGKENPPDFSFQNMPIPSSASLQIVLNGASGSDATYALGAPGQWEFSGPGQAGVLKYTGGDPVKLLILKQTGGGTFILKAKLKGNAGPASLDVVPPNPGTDAGIILTLDQGFGPQRFCVAFGGAAGGSASANDATQWKITNAVAQPGCPVAGTSSTSTTTSSTTTTTAGGGPCCGGASFHSFVTNAMAGDCGDIIDSMGAMPFGQLACGNMYMGGGQSVAPSSHAAVLPDFTNLVTGITSCSGGVATLGPTTSAVTGSNRTCTAPGCLFGAPVPILITDPGWEDVTFCLVGTVAGSPSGTLDCASGAETLNVPVNWGVYTSNIVAFEADPMHLIPGSQPCPICQAGICVGGPNNGMACTPGSSALSAAFPTSQDCPPDVGALQGTMAHTFQLTTGSITWTATAATNDPGSTVANQLRDFVGYCRDADATLNFELPPHQCWENGMAVGAPCSGVYETCQQNNNGAFFGPGGGAVNTITVVGTPQAGIGGGSATGTLVSLFASPPITGTGSITDNLLDVPGPGAIALPGTGTLCAVANPCP